MLIATEPANPPATKSSPAASRALPSPYGSTRDVRIQGPSFAQRPVRGTAVARLSLEKNSFCPYFHLIKKLKEWAPRFGRVYRSTCWGPIVLLSILKPCHAVTLSPTDTRRSHGPKLAHPGLLPSASCLVPTYAHQHYFRQIVQPLDHLAQRFNHLRTVEVHRLTLPARRYCDRTGTSDPRRSLRDFCASSIGAYRHPCATSRSWASVSR
jgi:hypothetical protein